VGANVAYRQTEQRKTQKQQRLQAFLDAAFAIWAQEGYESVSMLRVAKAAGSSIGNLYYYVRDRDQLLVMALQQALEPMTRTIQSIMVGKGRIHVRLSLSLTEAIHTFMSHEGLLRICTGLMSETIEQVFFELLGERLQHFFDVRAPRYYEPEYAKRALTSSVQAALRCEQKKLPGQRNVRQVVVSLLRWNFLALGLGKPTVNKMLSFVETGTAFVAATRPQPPGTSG